VFLPAVLPTLLTAGAPLASTDGTLATLPITVSAGARGRFTLVATNNLGSSDSFSSSGNSFTVINPLDDTDSDGDGFPDGLELLCGSDPTSAASVPDLTCGGVVLSGAFSLSNVALPPATPYELLSSAFSVSNTLLGPATVQQVIGPAVSVLNVNPLAPLSQQVILRLPEGGVTSPLIDDALALSIFLDVPSTGQTLIEGQTIVVSTTVSGNEGPGAVAFSVNGATFATNSAPPYTMTFTVPSGVPSLTFGATVQDATGETATASPVTVSVENDPSTTVTGRVIDSSGNAVKGAVVELVSEGLQAEFFDYAIPLDALPDLSGSKPTRAARVTAIDVRNPGGIFGFDPFGLGFAPDYAARFTGWIAISTPGPYTFFLGADEGAQLRLNGAIVIDMPTPASGYQERSATVDLVAGLTPIQITFYESTGNAQLQLSFVPPGGQRRVVAPSYLVPNPVSFAVVTDDTGTFAFRGVPTALEGVQVRATATINGQSTSASSVRVTPVLKEGVDVGDIILTISR